MVDQDARRLSPVTYGGNVHPLHSSTKSLSTPSEDCTSGLFYVLRVNFNLKSIDFYKIILKIQDTLYTLYTYGFLNNE